MAGQADEILGIDRKIIEGFLILFRDLYKKADMANYFLELKAGTSGINIAITNQRDALSHLVTVLNHPEWDESQKLEQLGNAEEHLRRAILEPYERAVTVLMERVLSLVEQCKVEVFAGPAARSDLSLQSVRERLRAINDLRQEGRSAKLQNKASGEWERGVASFIDAFDRLSVLETALESALLATRPNRALRRVKPSFSMQPVLWGLVGGGLAYLIFAISAVLF